MSDEPWRGLRILVTGATDGIGRVTAERLARAGAEVVVHARSAERAGKVVGASAVVIADLASLRDVAASAPEGIDVLVNNAGVGFGADRKRREESADGLELRFAVNYLAPWVLTRAVRAKNPGLRGVVNVASIGQETPDLEDLQMTRGYDGVRAYARSKLALIAMTFDLAEDGVPANALHPGTLLDTTMVREAGIAPQGPVARGAESIEHVLRATLTGTTGRYFDETREARAKPAAYDRGFRQRLAEKTRALVAGVTG